MNTAWLRPRSGVPRVCVENMAFAVAFVICIAIAGLMKLLDIN